MYELMGWEGQVNLQYVDMPLQNVKKQVELFFIHGENAVDKNIFKNWCTENIAFSTILW
jgi:hypothetical protein